MDQTLYVGDVYEEKGATVPDGWVLRISGTVDTSTAGVYEITYYAFNPETGQNATRVKTVEVVQAGITLSGEPVVSILLSNAQTYVDAGATTPNGTVLVTNLDGTSSETFKGLPNRAGSYTIIYYSSGATPAFAVRTIHVLDPNSIGVVDAPTTGPSEVGMYMPIPTTGPAGINTEYLAPLTGPTEINTEYLVPSTGPTGIHAEYLIPSTGPIGLGVYIPEPVAIPTTGPKVISAVTTLAMSAPSGITETNITDTSVNIAWEAVTGASSYTLNINNKTYNLSTPSATVSKAVTGLSPNITYSYTITAIAGPGYASNTSTTRSVKTDRTTFDRLFITVGTRTSSSISISWNALPGATYIVYPSDGTQRAVNTSTSFTFQFSAYSTPQQNTEYTFRVVASAINAYNTEASVTTSTLQGSLSTPVLYDATEITNTSFKISWSESFNASQYRTRVLYNGSYINEEVIIAPTRYRVVTGLNQNTDYSFEVRAEDTTGTGKNLWANSSWRSKSVTTVGDPTTGPSGLGLVFQGVQPALGYNIDSLENGEAIKPVAGYNINALYNTFIDPPVAGPKGVDLTIPIPTSGPKTVSLLSTPDQSFAIVGLETSEAIPDRPGQSFAIAKIEASEPTPDRPGQSFAIAKIETSEPGSDRPGQSYSIIGIEASEPAPDRPGQSYSIAKIETSEPAADRPGQSYPIIGIDAPFYDPRDGRTLPQYSCPIIRTEA